MNTTQVTLSQPDFGWFDRVVEGGPSFDASGVHGGGHYGVGGTYGQMGDLYASPSDPIFYMHHANLDRVWWSWQALDLEKRLTDISGPIYLMDYSNEQGGNVTLDFPLTVGVNAENITVADTMNIKGGVLCYDYDQLYIPGLY
ncbi:tyrosinase central domain protein [Neofusicoccum parvum]|uniref:Tyrosinase central domain protein n=1 Tax=Neofusicoccum parvum TaxID=310453 RepID=A0ACB5RZZ5_9PEZI|nr:tyrosinase central domain protein [Neofusicoccum parvum]